jgi:hypothetical protein
MRSNSSLLPPFHLERNALRADSFGHRARGKRTLIAARSQGALTCGLCEMFARMNP